MDSLLLTPRFGPRPSSPLGGSPLLGGGSSVPSSLPVFGFGAPPTGSGGGVGSGDFGAAGASGGAAGVVGAVESGGVWESGAIWVGETGATFFLIFLTAS